MSAVGHIGETICLIGCGGQGTSIADVLLKHGFNVAVHDRDITATHKARDLGARVEHDAAAAVRSATALFLVVTAGSPTLQFLARPEVRDALSADTLVVQMGNISVEDTMTCAAHVGGSDANFCEVILGGPISTILDGTCPLIYGGDEVSLKRVRPLVEPFGKLIPVGHVGHAAAFNIAGLMHLYAILHGFALATAMVERSGLDVDLWRQSIREGIGGHPGEFLADYLWPAHFQARNYGVFGPAQVKQSGARAETQMLAERAARLGLDVGIANSIRRVHENACGKAADSDWTSIYDELAPPDTRFVRRARTNEEVTAAWAGAQAAAMGFAKKAIPVDTFGVAKLTVRDGMNRRVARVRPDASMLEVAELMAVTQASDIIVVDADSDFIGVISEGDIIRTVLPDFSEVAAAHGSLNNAAQLFLESAWKLRDQPVARLIITNPLTLHPEDSLLKAGVLMAEKMIRRLPVVDDGKFVGSLSRADLAWISMWQDRPTARRNAAGSQQ